MDDAYGASTDDEADKHDDVESEQHASDADGDEQDVPGDGHMSDDASALPESVSGGEGCSSGDQQGHVLPFGYGPILICLTPGCNRRRHVAHGRGYVSPRCRGGALQSHCCRECGKSGHCSTCREVGPQSRYDYYGRIIHPEMSLDTQRLIVPPEPVLAALVPQLEQEEEVGETFFVAQGPSDVFIDDSDDDESPETESGPLRQREVAATRVTGWCNGDVMRVDGSMAIVAADTLSQMPHGRWRSCTAMRMSSGILHTGALTRDAESAWTAQISRCDSGVNIGMTGFRSMAMVYDGTGEELVWSLTEMLEGTHLERRTSNSGVIMHLVHSDHRVDTRAMLVSVGLNMLNTNPTAHHPLQSFITHGTTVATTPTHRDENNAILVQLRGSKEILIHPPALALPGCPARVFGDAAATNNLRWLAFDPFQLHRIHSSLWVNVVLVPGDVVVVPRLWWHAVRSTPGSVAISVPIRLDTIDERNNRRRTCRRDPQPTSMVRGPLGQPPPGEQPPNSRRTDYSLGADDPVAHYYALADTQLAMDCQVEYERLEGRVVTWHTGDSLLRFAGVAAAELGLGAQQTAALAV